MRQKIKRMLSLYVVPSVIVIGSLLPMVVLPHTPWFRPLVNEPLHSTVEALGAFASIVIALFLFQSKQERYSENFFLFAMGFLTMGLLDGLHAVTEQGHGFVLLRSIASLAGGFWFALVWLPRSVANRIAAWNKWFPVFVVAGSVLFGIWTLLFRETLPLMLENGKFTHTTVAINSLAGVFFLTAAGRLLFEFWSFDKSEIYFFACISLLFGLSALAVPYSQIWYPYWWWWHLLRLSAYLIAMGLVTYWYLQTVSALRVSITERKQTEEALRNEKGFTEGALNSLTDIFFVFDLEGRFLRWNEMMTAVSGYSDNEISAMKPTDFFISEDIQRVVGTVEMVAKEGYGSLEATVVTKDGRHIPFEFTGSLLKNKEGKPVGICGSGRDITERKKAEEALRESEKKYRNLVDNAIVGVYKTNLKGDFLYVNDALTKIFEFQSQEEIMAESAQARYKNPKDRDVFIQNLKKTGKVESFETEMLTKTGKAKNVLFCATIEGDVISGIIIDITERKRAEEKIRESEERYHNLFKNAHDMIQSVTPDGHFIFANPAWLKTMGYTWDDLQNITIFDILHTSCMPHCTEAFQKVISGESVSNVEALFITKDGRQISVEGNVNARFIGEKVVASQGIFRDITERKRAEKEMESLRRQYELILNSAGEGIVGVDVQGNTTFVNSAAAKLLGYEVEEIIGKHCHSLWHHTKADGSRYLEEECPVCATFKGGSSNHVRDDVFWRKDDTSFPVAYTSTPIIENDKLTGAVVAFRDTTEHKRAEERIQSQLQHLIALRDIDRAITSSFDLRLTLKVILEEVIKQLKVNAADALLFNPHLQMLEYAGGLGFRTAALQYTRLPMGKGHAGQAAIERRIIAIPKLSEDTSDLTRAPLFTKEGFVSYYAAPLITRGQVKGVLEIFCRFPLEPEQEWLDFLDALATQAAIAIDNAELFNSLQRSNIDLIMAYDATIEGWARALDYRDKETEGHSRRVTEMTVKMAQVIGMNDAELVHVRRGALLHDIGKMGIPDTILLKPGKLSDEEGEIMRKHPVFAYDLLSPVDFLRPALDIPYCHHEKWDGTGYPRALKKEQIPLSARIFSVVDVWDALCSDRPYRPAWSEEKAKEYIQQQAGKDFDPKVVEIFLKMEW